MQGFLITLAACSVTMSALAPRTIRKRRRRLWQAKPNLVHIPLMVLLFRQIIRYYIIRTSV